MQNHKLCKIILTDYAVLYFNYKITTVLQNFLNMHSMHYACFQTSHYQDTWYHLLLFFYVNHWQSHSAITCKISRDIFTREWRGLSDACGCCKKWLFRKLIQILSFGFGLIRNVNRNFMMELLKINYMFPTHAAKRLKAHSKRSCCEVQ